MSIQFYADLALIAAGSGAVAFWMRDKTKESDEVRNIDRQQMAATLQKLGSNSRSL